MHTKKHPSLVKLLLYFSAGKREKIQGTSMQKTAFLRAVTPRIGGTFHICNCSFGISVNVDAVLRFLLLWFSNHPYAPLPLCFSKPPLLPFRTKPTERCTLVSSVYMWFVDIHFHNKNRIIIRLAIVIRTISTQCSKSFYDNYTI